MSLSVKPYKRVLDGGAATTHFAASRTVFSSKSSTVDDVTTPSKPTTKQKGLPLCTRCHPAWASEGALVGSGRTPTVHQCPHSGKPVGGSEHVHNHVTLCRYTHHGSGA